MCGGGGGALLCDRILLDLSEFAYNMVLSMRFTDGVDRCVIVVWVDRCVIVVWVDRWVVVVWVGKWVVVVWVVVMWVDRWVVVVWVGRCVGG